MNREQIMKLTVEEMRLEIIKAKGWKKTGVTRFVIRKPGNNQMFIDDVYSLSDGTSKILFPNWPTDIAAAWELEVEIPEVDQAFYSQRLGEIIDPNKDNCLRWWDLIHATAEQRCRAWLMWKEGA